MVEGRKEWVNELIDGNQCVVSATVQGSLSWTMVSASALMEVAVKLFGANGGTGDADSGVANTNVEGVRVKNGRRVAQGHSGGSVSGGLLGGSEARQVTFTVDVHTEGSSRLGIGVRELGGGAVVVQVSRRSPRGRGCLSS